MQKVKRHPIFFGRLFFHVSAVKQPLENIN